MNHTYTTVRQLTKMLRNLDTWMTKGVEHAEKKQFDFDVLLNARLAPDMYPLLKHVQGACDAVKFAAARSSGKSAPKHDDGEKTLAEIQERIRSTLEFVEGFQEADFQGADERVIPLLFMEGKAMSGRDYLSQFIVPNFYFRAVTTYAILRHNGVEIGFEDYVGPLDTKDA